MLIALGALRQKKCALTIRLPRRAFLHDGAHGTPYLYLEARLSTFLA